MKCINGEPVFSSHTRAYFLADCFGRKLSISRFKIGHHINFGISISLGSDKNCFKYLRKAGPVGSSGVPS